MSNPLHNLVSEHRFEPFRQKNFDAAQFTSRTLSGAISSAQTTSQQLREDIKLLEEGIRQEVLKKRTPLHSVVHDLTQTEQSCNKAEDTIKGLNHIIQDLHATIQGPSSKLQAKTQQLKNLRATVGALRAMTRRLRLLQKLKSIVGDKEKNLEGVDLAEVARILADLHEEVHEVDVTGVVILQQDAEFLQRIAEQVRRQGELALFKGQEILDQAEVGNALQVFFNLHELPKIVEILISKKVVKLTQKARTAFDFHKLMSGAGGAGKPSLQENVWSSLRSLFTELEEETTQVWQLHEVLSKKTDPITHTVFLSVIENGDQMLYEFWKTASMILERSLSHAVQPGKSTPVREVLVHGFPKLCSLLEVSVERLSRRFKVKGKASVFGDRHLLELLKSTNQVQTVYSTRSLTHMKDAVHGIFSATGRTVPSSSEIQKLISVFHEEMKEAETSIHARSIVCSNVSVAVVALTQKLDGLSAHGVELRTLSNTCNAAQLRNIQLCSNLQEILKSMLSFAPKLDQAGAGLLTPALDALKIVCLGLITPIFKAYVEEGEQIILKMHTLATWSKDVSGTTSVGPSTPSTHVVELGNRLKIFQVEILQRFSPPFSPSAPSLTRSLVKRLCCRFIVFFIRHAALLRPLGSLGKHQLVMDCFYLETTISDSLLSMNVLGKQGLYLKQLRRLLECSTEDLKTEVEKLALPKSVMLHHLFSRCPKTIQLPHQRIGLTSVQFSLWLDNHTDAEAVRGVQSALEASSLSNNENHELRELSTFMVDFAKS